MKKFIFFLVLSAAGHFTLYAQKPDTTKITQYKQPPQVPLKVTGGITVITIYPQSGYRGTPVNYAETKGKLKTSFPLELVSFTVPRGKIVYLKKCDTEFPYEEAYTTSQSKADLSKVCGIRSDDLVTFTIQFNGMSTPIHNNDCKRFFGDIKVKVFEIEPGGTAQSFMNCAAVSPFRGPDRYTFLPFNNASASTTPPYFNYAYSSVSGVPDIDRIVAGRGGGVGQSVATFQAGAMALRDGRVSVLVTSNLGSAHKTCDLCDDFSSKVRMSAPATEAFPLNKTYAGDKIVNAAHNKVVLGPYSASGTRDGFAITASAGTRKDFRVHLTITGL